MNDELQRTLAHAQRECKRAGVRLTPKRLGVFLVVLAAKSAVSAYRVIDTYKADNGATLQAMSAYRILNFLVEVGLVHRLETINQYIACAHITCHHPHQIPQFLICSSCHRVTEMGLHKELISELKASVEDTGFHLPSQQLELHGICGRCRARRLPENGDRCGGADP